MSDHEQQGPHPAGAELQKFAILRRLHDRTTTAAFHDHRKSASGKINTSCARLRGCVGLSVV
jgi:hypothetical protein